MSNTKVKYWNFFMDWITVKSKHQQITKVDFINHVGDEIEITSETLNVYFFILKRAGYLRKVINSKKFEIVKKIPNLSLSNFRSLSGDLITFDNDSVLGVGKYLIVMKNNENVIPIFNDGNQHRLITLSNDPNLNRYYSVDQISKYVKI